MKQTNESLSEGMDKDILFSRTVKAGKRVYYIDVKRDRKDALYMSITESKRIKEGNLEERPVFEKHKLFLYREDMEKFMEALTSATNFAIENAPEPFRYNAERNAGEEGKLEDAFVSAEQAGEVMYGKSQEGSAPGASEYSGGKIKFDIDF